MVSGRWIPVQLAEGGPLGDGERSWHTGVAVPVVSEWFPVGVQILKCPDLRICTDFHKSSIYEKLTVYFLMPMKYQPY